MYANATQNIKQKVWNYIEEREEIKNCLTENIINISALAKKIKKELNINATIHAIISAIRRYPKPKQKKTLIKEAEIETHTDITIITWKAGGPTEDLQAMFNAGVLGSRIPLKLLKGNSQNTAILPEKKGKQLVKNLPEKRIKKIEKEMGEITIKLRQKDYNTPGILAKLSKALARKGINVEKAIATRPYIYFYVKEKELAKAQEELLKIKG